jgi:hypothetical protein
VVVAAAPLAAPPPAVPLADPAVSCAWATVVAGAGVF